MAAARADFTTSVEEIISEAAEDRDYAKYGLFTPSLTKYPIIFIRESFSF